MKLYYFPISTYSIKAVMGFHEKGVSFQPEHTPLLKPEVREAYLKIYPLGKIPLLVLDDGHMIPESTTIIEYLDMTFDNGSRLIPNDPTLARQTRWMDRMFDLYLNDSIVTLLFDSWKPENERNPEATDKARFQASTIYKLMEDSMGGKTWTMGEEFSLADCAAAPALFYAQQLLPFDDKPVIREYWERLQSRDSWQKVMAEAGPILAEMQQG